MRLIIGVIVVSFLLVSCETKPYIKHDMKVEKIGDCTLSKGNYKVTANINGERYEFNYCLKDGFDGKNYSLTRFGDTLSLELSWVSEKDKMTMYKLILDVNAYPKYNYIKIGDDVLNVVTTGN